MAGFTGALIDRGIPLLPEMVIEIASEADVRLGVSNLLKLPEPPTAIFAYQDSMAAVVYRQLEEEGLSIPADMTVVGFDNLDLATYLSPQLTTVGTHISPLTRQVPGATSSGASIEPDAFRGTPCTTAR